MAFDIKKGGAYQEPEEVKRPEVGAWIECESAKRKKDGAWQEVWSNVKIMTKESDNITTGILQIMNEGLTFDFLKFATAWEGKVAGTLGGGGTIVLYLDGDWTDPVISLDWAGGFIYQASNGLYYIRVSAGSISIYTRTPSGQESTRTIVSTIGSTLNGAGGVTVDDEQGQYLGTINGTYNRIGLSITISGYGDDLLGSSSVEITNLLIDGRKVGFPADAAFDRQDWEYK